MEALLSISEASQVLGVSETALRQWTDEGKLKAFVTPGGHRRYSRLELKRFMSTHQKTLGIKDLVLQLEDTVPLHRELDRTLSNAAPWYEKLDDEAKRHLADLGRRLMNLITRYVSEPSKREEIMLSAHEIGDDFGTTLCGLGLSLTDAVEAYIRHRDPIMQATTHLMRRRESPTGRVVEAIPLVSHVMDEVLVALVASHQQHRNRTPAGRSAAA
ncbi:MAG: helix-turn-helix domain-containing protein [Chloroflexi bacterium]|nr:helix-turn-helix domain-containing protein [Chloroflexota bacterium]